VIVGAGSPLGPIKPRDKIRSVRLLNRALRIDDIGPQVEFGTLTDVNISLSLPCLDVTCPFGSGATWTSAGNLVFSLSLNGTDAGSTTVFPGTHNGGFGFFGLPDNSFFEGTGTISFGYRPLGSVRWWPTALMQTSVTHSRLPHRVVATSRLSIGSTRISRFMRPFLVHVSPI
jgi:hypothetical protein